MGLTRRKCPKSETPFKAQKVQSFIMKYAAMAVSRKNLETSDEKYPKKESLGTKKTFSVPKTSNKSKRKPFGLMLLCEFCKICKKYA